MDAMLEASEPLRVILIGGSSHAGKSALAESLASRLGWEWLSTDSLARHPGRPWKTLPQTVPEHVAEHYLSLSIDELINDVLRHYRSMWPNIEAIIASHATDFSASQFILEGSALWPESVATLDFDNVAAFWLTADDALFQKRIHTESRFSEASAQGKIMIQKFLQRTLLYNEKMMDVINRLGFDYIEVDKISSPDQLCDMCFELLQKHAAGFFR